MTNSTGFGEASAQAAIDLIISGGATIHLIGGNDSVAYTDTATEIGTKSDAQQSVAEADWTITTPADFTGTATLQVDVEVNFGSQNIGVVDDIVIQNDVNTELWILADEPSNPDLTGEEVIIPVGHTVYELGNA